MKTRHPSIAGFSLVEVTLALGVVVFCLVTILGLLAVGANSTHVSAIQTSATNILTAVASDMESTPNITPAYTASGSLPVVKGTVAETSEIYGITVPAGGAGATSFKTVYIAEDGTVATTTATALYELNVWVRASSTASAQQETVARLMISWPAQVQVFNAAGTQLLNNPQGYVENVIAINRT
jgi:Tfp pilus assembly protein PilV